MSYTALYRLYRPKKFEDIVGQQHIVQTLQNSIKDHKFNHAYLFCGPRGTGKTSVARIMAKAINCEDQANTPCEQCANCQQSNKGIHPDLVEIDGASNNGVENIRALIEKSKYSPIEGKYKIYIIDEVHMLSTSAFNALLKTLEEPPKHVIFILATTEPHKVLPTVISRCQRYNFTKVNSKDLTSRLQYVCQQENISASKEALELISLVAEGGVRDALSILDQCIAYGNNQITEEQVNEIYGLLTVKEKINLLTAVINNDSLTVLQIMDKIIKQSINLKRLTTDLISLIKNIIVQQYTNDQQLMDQTYQLEDLEVFKQISTDSLFMMIDILMDTSEKYRTTTDLAAYFEVALLKLMNVNQQSRGTIASSKPSINNHQEQTTIAKKEEPINEEIKQDNTLNNDSTQQTTNQKHETMMPEKEEQESVKIKEEVILDYSEEEILGLLNAASNNKAEKESISQRWSKIEEYCFDLDCARWAQLLKDFKVFCAGENYLIITSDSQALVNEVNRRENKVALIKFIYQVFNVEKQIIALDNLSKKQIIAKFMEIWQTDAKQFPCCPKIEINHELVHEQEKKEKTSVELLKEAFSDQLEIKP